MKVKQFLALIVIFLVGVPSVYAVPVAIDIFKEPDIQYISPGGTAFFTIRVINTGAALLTTVVVTDPITPDCDALLSFSLDPGEETQYTCQTDPVSGDFTNTVSVTADSVAGPVSDSDTADVTVVTPLAISKAPASQTVERGEVATFTITVENLSSETLSSINVTDPLSPDCERSLPNLPATSSTNYTCQSDPVNEEFVNTATVTATYNSFPFSDSDSAVVNLPGGGGGGCNTVGPAGSAWTDLLWIAMLGGVIAWMRKKAVTRI